MGKKKGIESIRIAAKLRIQSKRASEKLKATSLEEVKTNENKIIQNEKNKQKYAEDKEFREKKLEENLLYKKKMAEENSLYRQQEYDEYNQKYETDKEFRTKKLEENLLYKKKMAEEYPLYRQQEYDQRKQKYETDKEFREKLLEENLLYKKKMAEENPLYRQQEYDEYNQKYETDKGFRTKKLEENSLYMKNKKSDTDFIEKRSIKSAQLMRELRKDREVQKEEVNEEKKNKKKEIKEQKLNHQFEFRTAYFDEINDTIGNSKKSSISKDELSQTATLRDFIADLRETPSVICTSCEGLFFKNNPRKFDLKSYFEKYNLKAKKNPNVGKKKQKFVTRYMKDINEFQKHVVGIDSKMICETCSKNLTNGKIPLAGPLSGIRRPEFYNRPEELTCLTDLEALLITPVIPFMQIMSRTPFQINPQLFIKGSVINVVPEISNVLTCLPHKFDDTSVVQLDFKRNLNHKSSYMHDVIRPKKVFTALHYLLSKPLYQKYGIKINEDAFNQYDPESSAEQINFIIPNKDEKVDYISKKDDTIKKLIKSDEEDKAQIEIDKNEKDQNEKIKKIKNNYMIFPNDITVQNDKNQLFEYRFMSPFNSIFHGLIGACITDERFYEHIKELSTTCKYFKFLIDVLKSTVVMNAKWIKLLILNISSAVPNFQENSGKHLVYKDMHCSIDDAIMPLLNNEYASFRVKKICDNCKNGASKVLEGSVLDVFSRDKNLNQTLQKSLIEVSEITYSSERCKELDQCLECQNQIEKEEIDFEFCDLIFINILNADEKENKSTFSNLYEHIPNDLILNGNIYELKFVIHRDVKNFITYLKQNDQFIELNSLTEKETVIQDRKHKINPAFLCYFKMNIKFLKNTSKQYVKPAIPQIDTDHDLSNFKVCDSLENIKREIETITISEELERKLYQMETIQEEEEESLMKNPDMNDHVLILKDINTAGIQKFIEDYSLDPSKKVFNDVHVVAPGFDKRPIPSCNFKDYDAITNPRAYCGYGQDYDRDIISYTRVIRNEVNHYDRSRFTPQDILFKAKEKIKRDLGSSVSIALRKCKAGTLTKKDVLKPENIHRLVSKNLAFRILPQIRTSNEYLKQKELRARRMIRQFGICNLFFTCGLAESHSPELLKQAYKNVLHEDISLLQALNLNPEVKNFLIRQDPVLCAEIFNHRSQKIESFMKKSDGLFGKNFVTHFMKRTETQMRGSIHEHDILWLKDAPILIPYASGEVKLKNEREVIQFLNLHISTKFLKDHPNMNFQIHNHTHSCYKNQVEKICRFHYPRYVCHQTMILYPQQKQEKTKKRLEDLKKIKAKMIYYKDTRTFETFEEMLKDLKMTMAEYYEAIRCDINKISVFYERESDAVMVNNYNPTLLNVLEANHDIQFITDSYAAIHYLFKYCLKIDEGVNFLMEKAIDECRLGNKTLQETYKKIASIFHNTSYISAQQAVQEIKGYPIVKFSEDEKFINTNPPADRSVLLKSAAEIDLLEENSSNIYEKGFIEQYCERPSELTNVTLADFAAYYEKTTKTKNKSFENDEASSGDDEIEEKPKEPAVKGLLYRKRLRPRVIRFVNYKLQHDEENYYRELCMLYWPFRDEQKELLNYAQVKETFAQNKDAIMAKYAEYNVISESELEELKEQVIKNLKDDKQEEIQRFVADELSDAEDDVDIFEELGIVKKDKVKSDTKKLPKKQARDRVYAMLQPQKINKQNLHARIRSLNEKQQEFVMHMYHLINTRKEIDGDEEGTKIILQGRAGVGKTYVINIITELVNDFYNNTAGADFKTNKVLLCAPTGISAYLIRGSTIHSAFQINSKFGGTGSRIRRLGDDLVNSIRREQKDVKVIIADEYSMISRNLRISVDQRCREIYGVLDQSYGGKIMIYAGDLFQLPPVKALAIYRNDPKANERDFALEMDWWNFRMFEFDVVVRQKDARYMIALENLALGKLTEDDKVFLKLRIVKSETQVPEDAIWLYFKNDDVDEFNNAKIAAKPGKLFEAIADDNIQIPESSKKNDFKITSEDLEKIKTQIKKEYSKNISSNTRMKYNVSLKLGIRYKCTSNIKVSDGLTKGAMGILVRVDVNDKNQPVLVWLKFKDENIGKEARQQFLDFMKEKKIPLDAVPIRKFSESMTDSDKITIKIYHEATRNQFPIAPCEASTFHSVQGLSIPKICMDLRTSTVSTALAYVGLSRCDYEGLFFLGKIPICTPRQQHLTNEIFRLRNSANLQLSFYNFDQYMGVKIIYHNVNSYKAHGDDVTSMHWYWNADVIILSEANVQSSDEVKVRDGFKVLYPNAVVSDKIKQKRSLGLIIICKNTCKIQNLSEPNIISNHANTYHIDLRSFEVDNHLIITGYCHPKAPIEEFKNEIKRLSDLRPQGYEITIMGDMNYDAINTKVQSQNSFFKLLKDSNLVNYLGESKTNRAGSQIDILFSSSKKGFGGTMASYFSDHFAIYFQTQIDPSKLSFKHKLSLPFNQQKTETKDIQENKVDPGIDDSIEYNIIQPENIKSGFLKNIPFKNEIHASLEIDGKCFNMKFTELSSYNAVFSAISALTNYSELFQSVVEGLYLNYPLFQFVLEIRKNYCTGDSKRNQQWVNFLLKNFPNIIELSDNEIEKKSKNMRSDITSTVRKLLSNWYSNMKEKENEWVSWEHKVTKCKTMNCKNVFDIEREMIIDVKISKTDSVIDLANLVKSSVTFKPLVCSDCNKVAETSPLITFSKYAIIISLKFDQDAEAKINIASLPRTICLNNSFYALKIAICNSDNNFSTYYRIKDGDFLEMDSNIDCGIEFVLKNCKENLNIELLIYVKSEEKEENNDNLSEKSDNEFISYLSSDENETELENYVVKSNSKEDESCIEEITTRTLFQSDSLLTKFSTLELDNKSSKLNSLKLENLKDGVFGDVPFPNNFDAVFQINNVKDYVNFFNMCPFNSFFSSLHSLYNHTDVFRGVEQELRVKFPFFNFMLEINENYSNPNFPKNQNWINFISKYFGNEINANILEHLATKQCFQESLKMKRANMENDIILVLTRFFDDYQEISQKSIFSCIRQKVECDKMNCNGTTDEDVDLFLNICLSKSELEKKIETAFMNYFKTTQTCNLCNKNILYNNPKFSFGECIVLIVNVLNETEYSPSTALLDTLGDELNNTKININKIQKKIIFNNTSYALKVIIDHSPGHFKTYFRIKDYDFLEMDDTRYPQGKEIIQRNMKKEINPKVLIFIKSNESFSEMPPEFFEIISSKLKKFNYNEEDFLITSCAENEDCNFEYEEDKSPVKCKVEASKSDVIIIDYSDDESSKDVESPKHEAKKHKSDYVDMHLAIMGEISSKFNDYNLCYKVALIPNSVYLQKTKETFNFLCPYNSTLNGFVKLINIDSNFRNFVASNKNNFRYFDIILKLITTKDQNERNEIWINFLHEMYDNIKITREPLRNYPFKKTTSNCFSMLWSADEAFHYICPNFLSYKFKFLCKCGEIYERKNCILTLSCSVTNKNKDINSQLTNLNSVTLEKLQINKRICSLCKTNFTAEETEYSDMIMINTSFPSNNDKILLTDIPILINVKKELYQLKFLIHYEYYDDPNSINHLVCYAFDEKSKNFFYINDLGQTEKLVKFKAGEKIHPVLICYQIKNM